MPGFRSNISLRLKHCLIKVLLHYWTRDATSVLTWLIFHVQFNTMMYSTMTTNEREKKVAEVLFHLPLRRPRKLSVLCLWVIRSTLTITHTLPHMHHSTSSSPEVKLVLPRSPTHYHLFLIHSQSCGRTASSDLPRKRSLVNQGHARGGIKENRSRDEHVNHRASVELRVPHITTAKTQHPVACNTHKTF